jgi:GTP-binding protein YchF
VKIAIVGEPRSGKSALLHLLLAGENARRGRNEHEVIVEIPDPRLDWLEAYWQPRKTTHATLEFLDVGGDLRHAGKGLEELLALPDVGQCRALALVLRGFDGTEPDATQVGAFELATAVADLERVERRLEKLHADRKRGLREGESEVPLLERLRDHLLDEQPLRTLSLSAEERARLRGYEFLSLKPVLVVANVGESAAAVPPSEPLKTRCEGAHHELCSLSAPLETELAEMDPADRDEFMAALGLAEPARDRFLRSAYAALGLISFLTMGKDECRAWTVPRGVTAPEAAGRIHSDLQRGFIRAEVVSFDDLATHGELKTARAAGLVRLEGREYEVMDGDILEIRFSV